MSNSLYTNKTNNDKLKLEFDRKLNTADNLYIATGYVGASLLYEYENKIISVGKNGVCKILVGMVFHSGVSDKTREILMSIDEGLRGNNPDNGVYISRPEYHGKIYRFQNKEQESIYLGSSNFSEHGFLKRKECTVRIDNEDTRDRVVEYLEYLFENKETLPLSKVDLRQDGNRKRNKYYDDPGELLSGYEIDKAQFPSSKKIIGVSSIELSVDIRPESSLNLFFGKGRVDRATRLYAPRPWYEIELAAVREEYTGEYYPPSELTNPGKKTKSGKDSVSRSGKFVAYMEDDGKYYKLDMVVSSDYGKNIFTSETSGGRETLGMLIKGKLKRMNLLSVGERVTSEVLEKYGKSYVELKKIGEAEYILVF